MQASRASAVVSRGQAGQEELRGVEQSASHLEIRLREKSLSLERVLDLSDAAIEFQLRNFEAARAASSEQLLVHGRAAEGAERRLQALREGVDGLNTARGEARSAVAALEAAKSRHQETSSALARKFSLRTLVPSWEPSKALELSAKLAEKEGLLRAEAKTQLAGLRADCEAREERQGRLREALQKLSLEGAAAERDMARVQRERDQCRGEQSRLVSAKDELAQAENKLQAAKTALSELQSTTDLRRTQTELAELSSRIKELGQSIAQDAELLRDMAHFKEESDRLQLALKQSDADLVAGTSDAALLFERNYELMGRVGQTSAPASLADLDSLVAAVNAAQRETREALAERKKEARDLNERTAQLTLLKDQIGGRRVALTARLASQAGDRARLKKLASELNDLRAYFMPDEEAPLGEGASLKEMEATAEEVVEIAQEVFYSLGTRRKVYEKFEKARERSSACPCCKRDMSEREEGVYKESVAKFFQKKHFENMSVTETHTARAKEVLGLVRGAGGALADADAVEAELRQSSELEAQYDRDSNAARVQEKEKAGEMRASEETAAALDHLLLEVHALRRRLVETTERRAELRGKQTKQSQSMASTHLDGRDYAAIDEAVRVRVGEREALQLRKDALQGDDSRASARLYAIKTRVGEAEKELLEAATHFEKLSALQTRFSELDKSFRELSADRTAIASKASAMQPDLRDAEEALKLAREGLQRAEEDWGVRSQLLKRDVDELARCSAEVELLRKRVESTNLEALERELADAQRSIDAEEEAIKGLQQKASQIQQELSSEERTRKELQDNLDVRALSAEYEGLKARLRDLRAKHEPDAKGVEDARRELQRCAQERQRLATEEATIRGRLKEVHEQTAEVNGKLGNPTYRNIAERHRKKNIEYETTLMAVSDLDSYYHALYVRMPPLASRPDVCRDGALATYHLLKIKEINKIIRELWQQVYRGDDIDRIEISSESEAESGAATKKSYNYRVVMTKGSVPLDMRGRCSAGQRVLAAIVIRLALAETFCLSCGMLALDEPTTNLDDANRAGLAHALARIISTRSKQLNFQLVCITHDEVPPVTAPCSPLTCVRRPSSDS